MNFDYKKIVDKVMPLCRQNIFIAAGILGIILIALSDINFKEEKTNINMSLTLEEYCDSLETEVAEILSVIDGVGQVKVMITMESGVENIYAEQEKSTADNQKKQTDGDLQENARSSYENEIVIVTAQNTNQPLIEKTIQPVVKGVAVVCTGADDILVESAVINTVSVVLNISTNRIYVTKMR